MVFERRIIITSNSLSLLSASVHGCTILLYPLLWQHIFIPIMPQHLKDYCAAPMPFLMGVHSSLMEDVRRMPMDDVVILDMDDNVIESPHVDDLTNMPGDVISELKHVLKKDSSAYGDNVCKAFMLAMVSMIGGYRKALKFREGETEVVFDEEVFFTSRPQMEEFLASLLHFQHFRQFINHKIEQLKNKATARDIFDMEAMFYDDELKGTTQEKMKTAFNKFIVSTKGGGKRLLERGEKWSNQIQKGVSKGYGKIVDKKAFQKLVKETKRTWHELARDRVEDSGGENGSAIGATDKSNTFPMTTGTSLSRSSSGLSNSGHPSPLTGTQAAKKAPPRVIPYQQHQEGKKRLAEVLKQQNASLGGGPQLDQVALLQMLTSPESPSGHSLHPPPDDHAEKASLDSRGSTEASVSVSSGEVATATLIDLADEARSGVAEMGTEGRGGGGRERKAEPTQRRGRSSTGSDSMVSTASSSSEELTAAPVASQRTGWVNFDEDESSKPPLPPPRSELDTLPAGAVLTNPMVQTEAPAEVPDSNQFSGTEPDPGTGRVSPFEDFSAQVARTLFTQSRNRNSIDSYTADLMATASQDLYRALGPSTPTIPERIETETLPEPLIPTASSTSLSSLGKNCCPRPSTNPFAPLPLSSATNGFPASVGHPVGPREWVQRPRGPPPPKPQPYSGKPLSELRPQIGTGDPFGNLLEGMSMQAYAHSSAAAQLPLSPQHTAVESPLV
jgi:hypothetical protein